MPVNTEHAKYAEMKNRWSVVNDVCDGSVVIEKAGEKYLPKPVVASGEDNNKYYQSYLSRAVFYDITKDTLQKNVGIAFSEDPNFQGDNLDLLKHDADGTGKSIYQVAQSALQGLLKQGRGGFFVDHPESDNASVADVERNGIRPTIMFCDALSIINWRVRKVGAIFKTDLVVLKETSTIKDQDEFVERQVTVYRVLRLDEDGYYNVQVYSDKSGTLTAGDAYYPMAKGSKWTEIPFIPLGSMANDWSIDPIPLESMALMNLAHYRNSASYEEMTFLCGQAQPIINELDTEWRDWLQQQGLLLGSKNPLMLPKGSSFDYVQVQENTLAKQAMDAKEVFMQSQGAKIIEVDGALKTATQSNNEKQSQYSVLSLCVANINEAMEYAIKWCAEYLGQSTNAVFQIKQDFARSRIDLDTLKFYNELVLQGKMSKQTFFAILTTGKVPELNYEEEQKRIEEDQANQTLPSFNSAE